MLGHNDTFLRQSLRTPLHRIPRKNLFLLYVTYLLPPLIDIGRQRSSVWIFSARAPHISSSMPIFAISPALPKGSRYFEYILPSHLAAVSDLYKTQSVRYVKYGG